MSSLAIPSDMSSRNRGRPTETTIETDSLGQDDGHQRLPWSEVVARDGVEPSTFRFQELG